MILRSCVVLGMVLSLAILWGCGGDDDPSTSSGQAHQDDDTGADDDAADDDTADDDTGADDDGVALRPYRDVEHPGPFAAGVTTRFLVDDSRTLRCGDGPWSLMTEIWYPADPADATGPQSTVRDFFGDRLAQVAAAYEEMGNDVDEELVDLPINAWRDIPLAADAPPAPVLVFSHGFTGQRFQNYRTAAYLATHGYVVVAPDHICNAHVTLTESEVVPYSIPASLHTLADRKNDLRFLIDVFTESPPDFLIGRLDGGHVGLWGHSFGGITVTEDIKNEPRASALVQLASFGIPSMPDSVRGPGLFLWGDQDKWMILFTSQHNGVIATWPDPAFEFEFPDTGHFAFSDMCDYNARLAAMANGCGTESAIGGGTFTNPTPIEMEAVTDPYVTALFGAAFFDDPELWNYLGTNQAPDMMNFGKY